MQAVALLALKAVFYMTSEAGSVRSFLAHTKQIDIVIPAVYSADAEGVVRGTLDPQMMEAARQDGVPVMPIIVNPGFDQPTVHAMLINPEVRTRLARRLLEECRRHRFYGIQFDFENVAVADRDALTALVRETAAALGAEGFKLSIAAMYQSPAHPGSGGYSRWLYDNWLGAYDLPEIAKHVEFISVMTYDQHTDRTPPGPIAGLGWVEEVLRHCLKLIPKEKLSLGIPLYGRRWHAAAPAGDARPAVATLSAPEAIALAAEMGARPQFDPRDRAPWFHFLRDGVREYVFYSDARSFRERYRLAERHGVHGFSAWVLGAEDPAIWKLLTARSPCRGSAPC